MIKTNYRDFLFLRVGTVGCSPLRRGKPCTLLMAARHNLREIQAELGADSHIYPKLSHLNQIIAGHVTAVDVVTRANECITQAGVKIESLRKDHVQAIELLFSLSPETKIDITEYFKKCVAWAATQFGESNVLSAVIHHDEDAPHCHVLLLPLVHNRMLGSQRIDKNHLSLLRRSFTQTVALPAGLNMPSPRLRGNARARGDRLVKKHIESCNDPVLNSELWPLLRNIIKSDPAIFLDALNIEMPLKVKAKKKMKLMAAIFTGPGRGPKIERGAGTW